MPKIKQNKRAVVVKQPIVRSVTVVSEDKANPIVPNAVVPEIKDERKRLFLRLAGIGGIGAIAAMLLPKKAQAYILGSAPATSIIGVKDTSNTQIDPATEETLASLISGQGVTKLTTTLSSSGTVHSPASGKKIHVYSTRFSLTADAADVSFRFTSLGTDYEKYVSPKTGGLYGANNHPNYIEGAVNQDLYCNITGTTTVQINIDYLEV